MSIVVCQGISSNVSAKGKKEKNHFITTGKCAWTI